MKPDLTIVNGNLPDAPYPADTTFPGWVIEIDLDRLYQSRTWTLADNDVKPWLLRLWIEAWRSIPAGSLEADDAYICARIGCKPEWFAGHRENLMRGWRKHADGLLYHNVITEQVVEMLERRMAATQRQRKRRSESKSSVSDAESRVSHGVSHVTYAHDHDQDQDKEKIEASPLVAEGDAKRGVVDVPYQEILDLYHSALPTWKRVKMLTETRRRAIRARWQTDLPTKDHWAAYFRRVAKSPFLTNRTDNVFRNDNIDFLVRPANMAQIIEGKYDQRRI